MSRIYRHPTNPTPDIPNLDLLTFLFDSEHTAASLLEDSFVLHAEAVTPSNNITKGALRSLVQRIAHNLRTHFSIGASGPNKDVVTVISDGQILVPAAFFGVIAAGGVYSAASPSSTTADLERTIRIGESSLVICGVRHVEVARAAATACGLDDGRVLVLDSSSGKWTLRSLDGKLDALAGERELPWERITDPTRLKDSLIAILWSSGTTGLPKGVQLSHLNLVAETYILALPAREWAMNKLASEPAYIPPQARSLAHLPISHIAGMFGYLIHPLYNGGTVFWLAKYNWRDLVKYAEMHKITAFYTVPSIFLRIAKSVEAKRAFRHVIGANTGAAPMDAKLQRAANEQMGVENEEGERVYVGQTWGLSETTGAVTAASRGEPDDTGSIGEILPGVELRIVDEGFEDVDEGEEGELLVRGPVVTNGYFKNPEATKAAFRDGWFCTGDIGVVRNGKFYVVDRKKEILKFKGQQVAPAELENVLFTHPQVVEAAVIGVPAPDDPSNELPRAYVVVKDRSKVSAEELAEFVRVRVAPYKQLRGGVVFVDEVPKSAIGKYLRRELRERAKKEMREAGAKL